MTNAPMTCWIALISQDNHSLHSFSRNTPAPRRPAFGQRFRPIGRAERPANRRTAITSAIESRHSTRNTVQMISVEMTDKQHNLDYAAILAASRRLDLSGATQKIKVALLSDAATQRFVPILRTLFARQGVDAEIYEGPFDAIELEVYDRGSGLYMFQPQVVVLLNCVQALRADFLRPETNPAAFVDTTSERIARIWAAIQANIPATLIQSNFVLPYERFFGNFDQKVPQSLYATVAALNSRIAENSRSRG